MTFTYGLRQNRFYLLNGILSSLFFVSPGRGLWVLFVASTVLSGFSLVVLTALSKFLWVVLLELFEFSWVAYAFFPFGPSVEE
ncbi:MAG TPA: hypothetical protein ENK36_03010 [Desulfobacterales bacterium]|nr:hypothetical protein [Desulfobacterales bacterium]